MTDHESASDCKLNFTKEFPAGGVLYMRIWTVVNGELHRTLCIIFIIWSKSVLIHLSIL